MYIDCAVARAQDDNTMSDAFTFAAVVALLWVLVKAWGELAQIK